MEVGPNEMPRTKICTRNRFRESQ